MSKGRISPEFLQKLKDAVNIIDVVGELVVLRKVGSNHTGLCPFHNERTPSFSVSEKKQAYHCHGCKKGGDILTFIQEIHGLSFMEAVEELSDRSKIPLPKDVSRAEGDDPEAARRRQESKDKVATAQKLNRFAAKFFRDQLKDQKHIAEYFKKRGVVGDLATNFYVGAAPASWDALSRFLVSAKAPMKIAEELGLVKPSQKGQGPGGPGFFDLFRNRAMFPIMDLRGKVVGFGGRGLPLPKNAPDVGDGTPKYLNSNESILFQKSKIAYGLYQAQKFVRAKDEVILVEGYFDVLALHGAGFQNAVATCGTALTEDHLKLFKKFCTKVTVLFDGDRAGITATDRAMEIGLQNGAILYGASMPLGLDPDEVLFDQETGKLKPDGIEKMQTILAGARPLLDARIEAAAAHALKGPEEKSKALKQVAEWLSMFSDPIGREVRIEAVARDLGVTTVLLTQAITQATASHFGGRGGVKKIGIGTPNVQTQSGSPFQPSGGKNISKQNPAPNRPNRPVKVSAKELVLLRGLARGGTFFAMFLEAKDYLPKNFGLQDLAENPEVRGLILRIVEAKKVNADLLTEIENPDIRAVLSEELVSENGPNAFAESDFRVAVQRSIAASWARFSQDIQVQLRNAELKKDANLQASLLQEYLDVQRRMKEFVTFYDEE